METKKPNFNYFKERENIFYLIHFQKLKIKLKNGENDKVRESRNSHPNHDDGIAYGLVSVALRFVSVCYVLRQHHSFQGHCTHF